MPTLETIASTAIDRHPYLSQLAIADKRDA